MPRDRTAVAAVVSTVVLTLSQSACDRLPSGDAPRIPGTVTLVNRVSAEVRCVTASACESRLEAVLRPRLDSVEIQISSRPTRVNLEFERTASVFSSASFRQALNEAGGEAVKIGIEACGKIDTVDGRSWITSGSARLLLDGAGPFATGTELCVTGELYDQVSPPRLVPGDILD